MVVTPIVLSMWTTKISTCAFFTFLSVLCMITLDLIAQELENPFGDDPNDLPSFAMQEEMNRDLLLLVHPEASLVPDLASSAVTSYETLNEKGSLVAQSLEM